MNYEESMELTKLYSVMGMLDGNEPLISRRPFREVHHTATRAALIGGGIVPRPGEISLAHSGILFMDELPEFPTRTRIHGRHKHKISRKYIISTGSLICMLRCSSGCLSTSRTGNNIYFIEETEIA